MIFKTYNGEVKSIDAPNTITVLVSGSEKDRDNERVNPSAFLKRLDVYKSHPVLLSSHTANQSLQMQIGEAKSVEVTSEGLVCQFEYYVGKGNAEADWAYFLASERKIASYSIGFMPFEVADPSQATDVQREFTDVELYEISQVLVPSFRGAIQEDRKLMYDSTFVSHAKAFYGDKEVDEVIEESKEVVKTGRVLSDKNKKKLSEIHQGFHELNKEFKSLLDSTDSIPQDEPEEKPEPKKDLEIDQTEMFLREIKKNLGGN